MSNLRTYQEEGVETLNTLENRYNFLPKDLPNNKKSLSKLCLKKTLDIAKNRKKNINTEKLENNLKQFREYAVKESN